jgi:hypothetical protein
LKISDDLKKRLLTEIDFCIVKIKEEENLRKKLYYFSGVYGVVERIMRLDFYPQLLLVHAALNICYNSIMGLIESRERGDIAREIPENLPEKLIEYVNELRNELAEDQDTYKTLEKFMSLAYQTTGPGYYSMQFFEYLKTAKQ